MAVWLGGISLVLQLLGISLAMLGLYDTWHAFARRDQRLRDALWGELKGLVVRGRVFIRRQLGRLEHLVRTLVRRPRAIHLHVGAFDSIGVAGDDLTVFKWENLPKTNAAAIKELADRIRDLLGRVAALESKMGRTEGEIENLRGELATATEALRARDEQVAITGIPMAVFGLGVVGVGLLFQLAAVIAA